MIKKSLSFNLMLKSKNTFYVALFVAATMFCCNDVHAQDEPRVITFSSENNQKSISNNMEVNMLKLNLFEMLLGSYGIAYERGLNDYFSVELALGVTRGNSFMSEFVFGQFSFDGYKDGSSPKLGSYVNLAPRFYFTELFEEYYIELGYSQRLQRWERSMLSQGIDETYTESRRTRGPHLGIGYSRYIAGNFYFDATFSVGRYAYLENEITFNPDGGSPVYIVQEREGESRFRFLYALKIGYLF